MALERHAYPLFTGRETGEVGFRFGPRLVERVSASGVKGAGKSHSSYSPGLAVNAGVAGGCASALLDVVLASRSLVVQRTSKTAVVHSDSMGTASRTITQPLVVLLSPEVQAGHLLMASVCQEEAA
jgi:hypothetical protein